MLQQHFETISKKILLSKLTASLQLTICINILYNPRKLKEQAVINFFI